MSTARAWTALPGSVQLAVARQYVGTRGRELRSAHPEVIGLGYGLRTSGLEQSVRGGDACLSLMVKRKRSPADLARQGRTLLPRHVVTSAIVDGRRTRFAIPTDVVDAATFRGVWPQAEQVLASSPGAGSVAGPLCCAVRFQGQGRLFGVGCHHVLAMSKITSPVPSSVTLETASSPTRTVGRLSAFRGTVDERGVFFDGALAEIGDHVALNRLLSEPLPGTVVVSSEANLSQEVSIHTFGGGAIRASRLRVWHGAEGGRLIEYPFLEAHFNRVVFPKTVVEVAPRRFTRGGDSGSPVFSLGGRILQGMLIAGSESGTPRSMFIPAYELLRARNYGLTSGDEMLTLAFPPF